MMCIPIALDVPVVSGDGAELGTAREILCPQSSPDADNRPSEPMPFRSRAAEEDLWLRVERVDQPDLFVPFSDITEVRIEGVRLGVPADDARVASWEQLPDGLAIKEESAA